MSQVDKFYQIEKQFEVIGRSLGKAIASLEASSEVIEQDLARALREAPERVKFINLPQSSGIGLEAFHHPIASFDARNWPRGAEIADLILAFGNARRNYERAYAELPTSKRPLMKEPGDFIDAES